MTAPIRPASTLILLKENAKTAPECFMVVRHHKIDVAAGALVFPGGKVETQDSDAALLASIENHKLPESLLPFAIAIVREAFEETGILFAKKKGEDGLIKRVELEALEHYRDKLVQEELSLREMFEKEELVLALDEIRHFAHWITPDMAPKRFDTHFFVAIAPADQVALHDGEESVDSTWMTALQALQEADEGHWKVVFPTRMNLEKLAGFPDYPSLLAYLEQSSVVTVQPEYISNESGKFLCIPESADYPRWKVPIEEVMNP